MTRTSTLYCRITDLALEAAWVALPVLAIPEEHNIGAHAPVVPHRLLAISAQNMQHLCQFPLFSLCAAYRPKRQESTWMQMVAEETADQHERKSPLPTRTGAEDVHEVEVDTASGAADTSDSGNGNDVDAPAAQVVITGCWLTVREVGLLLAAVASRVPIGGANPRCSPVLR